MLPFSSNSLLDLSTLQQEIKKHGNLTWPDPNRLAGKQSAVHSGRLAEILRTMQVTAPCTRLVLNEICLVGPLDLSGAGTMAAPIVPIELNRCCLLGGIDASHAYLQGLVIKDCHLDAITEKDLDLYKIRPATIVGRPDYPPQLRLSGATIWEHVEITGLWACERAIINFSHATFQHSCKIQDVYCHPRNAPPNGHCAFCETPWPTSEAIAGISCTNATITGGLTLSEICIDPGKDCGQAINLTELQLFGSLKVEAGKRPATIHGELTLTGAHIRGDVLFCGASLFAKQRTVDPHLSVTIAAAGLRLGGSFSISKQHHIGVGIPAIRPETNQQCSVFGQIDLTEAQITGDVRLDGHFHALYHTRIIKANSARIGGDVVFGSLLDRFTCQMFGEVDFSNAHIGGTFQANGSEHRLKRDSSCPVCGPSLPPDGSVLRRWRQFAVRLQGSTVNSNVVFQGTHECGCLVEGLALTGATIKGQLVIEGVRFHAVQGCEVPFRTDKARKAISANGSTILGGVYISEEAPSPLDPADPQKTLKPTEILGDFRLRNAVVNGPVIFRGVTMESSNEKVAFWAAGTKFGSDLIFEPGFAAEPVIHGEIRLWDATVESKLRLEGVRLTAGKTGSALDAALATVTKTIYIGVWGEEDGRSLGTFRPTVIEGIVNLNFVTCALLTLGQGPPRKASRATDPACLCVTGSVLLREARIRGRVTWSGLKFLPCEELADPRYAARRLKELAVFQERVIIYATHAVLGNRLFVRLNRGSDGLINLYASTTGTIGALLPAKYGDQEVIDEDWGNKPLQAKRLLAGRWRAGIPDTESTHPYIQLNLDEFRYNRLYDKTEDTNGRNWVKGGKQTNDESEPVGVPRKLWWLFLGRPLSGALSPRHGWLRHQIINPGMPEEVVTWPYRQLAKVYRDMGDLKRAYAYETERRWLMIRHTKGNIVDRCFRSAFGFLFGFGYSSGRALSSLLLWLALSTLFIRVFGIGHISGSPCSITQKLSVWDAVAEAFRLLVPAPLRLQNSNKCEFAAHSDHLLWNWLFYSLLNAFQVAGRILLIGATLTFTGLLQEKSPVPSGAGD